jgi:hypothetical protein
MVLLLREANGARAIEVIEFARRYLMFTYPLLSSSRLARAQLRESKSNRWSK